jgi:hypothetical protein
MNDGGEHDQGIGRPVGERPTTTNEAPVALESPYPRLQRGRLRRRPFEEMQSTDESTAAAAAAATMIGASSVEESRRGRSASWDRRDPISRLERRTTLAGTATDPSSPLPLPLPLPPAESSALEVFAALEPTPFAPGRGGSIAPAAILLPGPPPPGAKVPGALPFAAEDAALLAEKRGVANVDPPHPHPPLTHPPHRFITEESFLGAPTLALERLASWIGNASVSSSRPVLPSEPAPSDNMLNAMSESSQAGISISELVNSERTGPESTLMGAVPGAPHGVAFAGAAADWPRPLLSRHSSLPPPPPPTGALINHQVHSSGGHHIPFWQAQASLMDALSSSSSLSAIPSSRLPFTYGLEALSSDLFYARNQGFGASASAAVTSPNQSLSSSVWAPHHPALTRLPFPPPQQDLAMTTTTIRADPFASRGGDGGGGVGEAKSPSHELPSSPPLLGQQGRSPLLLQPAGLDQLFRVDRLLNVPSAATYGSLLHTNNAATKPGETTSPPASPPTTFASLYALHNSQSHVITFPRDSSLLTSPFGPIPLSMHPQMGRLKESMEESERTQKLLQDWDKLHGLPKSHSTTMVCTSRSRTQLLEGRILAKWDGTPLISREGRPEPKSRPRRIAATKASADDPSSPPLPAPLPELARAPAAAAAAHDAKTPKDASSSSSSSQDESEGSGDDCSSTTDDGSEAEGV